MDLVLSIKVQAEPFLCIECFGNPIEEEIVLGLWGGRKGKSKLSKKIVVDAYNCEECEQWTLSSELYEQIKNEYHPLRISTQNIIKYIDLSKNPERHYNPTFDKYGVFKYGKKMRD